ncbi:exosome complex protein Rrp42 [Candidatus Woesearchaeota archaeon]|nr:exosome complex protein Rrp42 [Candidatus Woesearchaeota archaeon]
MDNISREYLIKTLEKNRRMDGRKLDEYRNIEIEYGISKHAEGSARVRIGDTEVLAGVKLEVGEPFPDKPNEGTIIVNSEMLPLSSDEFESGPPGADSIELARVVDRAIRESNCIDLKKLCIIEKEKVWIVLIDIYTINNAGNLQDAACLASLAALKQAKIPEYKDEKIDYSKRKDKLPLTSLPVECTTVKVNNFLLSDPDFYEERWNDARLTIATTEKNEICAMQKGGSGVLSVDDVKKIIEISLKNGKSLREKLK